MTRPRASQPVLVTAIDVTALKLARDHATFLSNRDHLTGFFNRSSFHAEVERILKRDRENEMALFLSQHRPLQIH
jgi:GGDEF domain-containing protein